MVSAGTAGSPSPSAATASPSEEARRTVAFLENLQRKGGGFASGPGERSASLRDTVSAVKALRLLAAGPPDEQGALAFVHACWDRETGGFSDRPGDAPSVVATALGLIALGELAGKRLVDRHASRAMAFMTQNAESLEEHFMVIAAHEESGLPGSAPERAVSFIQAQRRTDGTFGDGVWSNAVAAGALLRARAKVDPELPVLSRLLGAQQPDGGFGDGAGPSDLTTTYAVMRALLLFNRAPDLSAVTRYLVRLRGHDGGYGERIGAPSTAGATYEALSILEWIAQLPRHALDAHGATDVGIAVRAARAGDIGGLRAWLAAGGDPNRYDDEGWTPLLAAASRGQASAVELLLFHDMEGAKRADPDLRFVAADALAIYMAGQAGDLETVKVLLRARPRHLFELSEVNGHTVLLQAAFYGSEKHLELAAYLLEHVGELLSLAKDDLRGIEDARKLLTLATNVRGYNASAMANLWRNEPMATLLERYDRTTEDERAAYLRALLERIRPPEPEDVEERHSQDLTDSLIGAIEGGLGRMTQVCDAGGGAIAEIRTEVLASVERFATDPRMDINRLGGPLQQPPVVVAVTGEDKNEHVAALRRDLTKFLLDHGADPDLPERHPMAVDAVIRAAVLNHFEILRLLADYMTPDAFAAALNEKPPVNGLTALHDSVHRALTAPEDRIASRLAQIRWAVDHGARSDIEDHTGRTQEDFARGGLTDPVFQANARRVLEALGLQP